MTQPEIKSAQRKYSETLYNIFRRFALEDQRMYYQNSVRRYRKAATEVNRLRALFALLTGFASALAGLIAAVVLSSTTCLAANAVVQPGFVNAGPCGAWQAVVAFLTILAVVAPAIGAAFTTLADLYQWDRLTSIYNSALENIEVADASSPVGEMDDTEYRAALRAFAEGALEVMRNETAQWGQVAQAPQQLERFIREEREKAARLKASADDLITDRNEPPPGGGE